MNGLNTVDNTIVIFCSICQLDKQQSEFYTSSLRARIYQCKSCQKSKRKSNSQDNDSLDPIVRRIFNDFKHKQRRRMLQTGGSPHYKNVKEIYTTFNDVRFLLENIWNVSTIFGDPIPRKTYRSMRLVIWNISEDSHPWNLVIMTESQARTHFTLYETGVSNESFYTDEIITHVAQKLGVVKFYYENNMNAKMSPR